MNTNLKQLNNLRIEYACVRSSVFEVIKRLELNRKELERGNTDKCELYIDDMYVCNARAFRTITMLIHQYESETVLLNLAAKYRGVMSVVEYYRMQPLSMIGRLKDLFRVLSNLSDELESMFCRLAKRAA
jgi:hypothetical protein